MSFDTLSLSLVVILTLGVLLVVLAIWWLFKPKAAKQRAKGESATRSAWPVRLFQGVVHQLSRALAGVRTLTQRREWRYRAPWILLLGPTGSGRSSLAASGGESRRESLSDQEAKLAVPGSSFVYFERGLLIDLDQAIAPDSQDPETRLAWNRVVAGLFDRRPERPLDGVVLALPATLLLQGSPAELRRWAERQYGQMLELQRRFEFTFPVYVVVTHCDAIEGFDAFWSRQDPDRLKEMVGWSNPYSLDSTFLPAWVDEAFEHVEGGLKRLQLQAAARAEGEPAEIDRFFLFPQRMQGLCAPLRQVLEGVFRGSAFHANFFMRGIYFTGVVGGQEMEDEARSDVAFVPALLEDKVFAEINLARATRQGLLSRHTAIRRLQLGTVGLFALLCTWLAYDANQLEGQIDQTMGALEMVKDHKIRALQGHGRCVGKEASYALQVQIARIDAHMSYPTIPVSWFDHRHEGTVSKRLSEEAFQKVIFPDLRCQLEERARDLLRDPTPPADTLSPADAAQGWERYILDRTAALEAFEYHKRIYQAIVSDRTLTDPNQMLKMFGQLALYLYGEPLPTEVHNPNGLFQPALVGVYDDPTVTVPKDMAIRITQDLLRWGGESQQGLIKLVGRGDTELKQLSRSKGSDAELIHDFTAWMGWIEENWLGADAQSNPCVNIARAMAPATQELKGYGYSASTLDELANLFGNGACFQPAMQGLTAIAGPTNTPLFTPRNGQWVLTAGAALERDRLKAAANLDFMQLQVPDVDSMVCRAPLQGWDDGKLREAMMAIRAYDAFAATAPADMPSTLGDRLARRKLASVVGALLTQAQNPLDLSWDSQVAVSPLAALEGEVRQQGSDFGRIKGDLVMLIAMLQQHGLAKEGAQLTQCARDFSGDVLGNIESLATASHLYQIDFHPVDGSSPPETLLSNLGGAAQTQELLDRQLQRAQVLAGYAAPFVNFLVNSEEVDDAHRSNRETAAYWGNTIAELNRFVQFKEPSGQVALLEDWVNKQLQPMTLGGCGSALKGYTSPPLGNDLFSLHRATLERQTTVVCKERKEAVLNAGYRALAHDFNQSLAGRFPFGDDPTRPAPLLATRQFFIDYAQQRQGLIEEVKAMKGASWRKAEAFLKQLDAVAAFFAPNLAATPGSQPIGVRPTFRAYEDGTPAWHVSDQLLDWRLRSGDGEATYPHGVKDLTWSFGQKVALEFDWADRSTVLPEAEAAQSDLSVDGPHAVFFVEGPWALLQMIAQHRPTTRPPADPLDPTTLALAFEIPVHRPEGDTGAPRGRMFLGLQLLGTDPTSKQPVPLTLPDFPTRAPLAW